MFTFLLCNTVLANKTHVGINTETILLVVFVEGFLICSFFLVHSWSTLIECYVFFALHRSKANFWIKPVNYCQFFNEFSNSNFILSIQKDYFFISSSLFKIKVYSKENITTNVTQSLRYISNFWKVKKTTFDKISIIISNCKNLQIEKSNKKSSNNIVLNSFEFEENYWNEIDNYINPDSTYGNTEIVDRPSIILTDVAAVKTLYNI
ncbi:hypothetical protein RFI_34622 [Reticulomyxa filosa]|uniref:Uncharacterized protein n=1 Tax=Reticulomyxa filosa TaxID=46433 RepID=X6LN40_RETFI|nr:hypothetical protein RFI_34622 [Reticulomyxa filosa]|eukprot:ETO02791.1 hypothetical protein RFI_34622 [Reticulomyxa filosa]